jgi:hypothetical protein
MICQPLVGQFVPEKLDGNNVNFFFFFLLLLFFGDTPACKATRQDVHLQKNAVTNTRLPLLSICMFTHTYKLLGRGGNTMWDMSSTLNWTDV